MPSIKVLVVEDHEVFCGLIISIVTKADYQVVGKASDGLEAIQKAEELQPDLILLDIGLPNLNGIEVARRLRKTAPHIKILFVSQESSSFEIVQATLDLGALGYVHKSQVQSDLVLAIESVLEGRQFVSSAAKRVEPKASRNARTPRFHEILAYSDEADLLESFTRFIGTALRAGKLAIVVTTELHRESILQKLKNEDVAVDSAIQQGTFIWLDSSETIDPARFLDVLRGSVQATPNATKTGTPRIALCGERAGRLWEEGQTDAALELEQLCNELGRTFDIDILCAYPLGENNEEAQQSFQRLSLEHTAVHSR